MKKVIYLFGLLIVILLLPALPSCSGSSGEIKASLGNDFTLPLGKTAVISSENLSFKFLDVTSDSRCAQGVQCTWAGIAQCQMYVGYKGAPSEITLNQYGSEPGLFEYAEYKIHFLVKPENEAGKQINKPDYKLIMMIEK
jgi:hypothetical protein